MNEEEKPTNVSTSEQMSMAYQSKVDADLIRFQLENTPMVVALEHEWKGEVKVRKYDDKGNPYITWERVRSPLMNDEGVAKVISRIKVRTHHNNMLTYLKLEEIQAITHNFADSLSFWLFARRELFEIDYNDMDTIIEDSAHVVQVTLKRALEQGERRFLKATEQIRQDVHYMPKQNNQSAIDKVKNVFAR